MGRPWEAKWSIGERLGHGGQGVTYAVTWKEDPSVEGVLKYLKNNTNPAARARMLREVNNLKALSNLGGQVPRVLDHNTEEFETSGIELFVVMSRIHGMTLDALLKSNGPLSIDQSVGLVLNMCRTVRIAHDNDILHRDLKPDNIIVDIDKDEVVILDYGLSFNVRDNAECITETGENFKNRFLDLPENNTQSGNRRDSRSDLTAVCAILYFCLTGGIPVHLTDGQDMPPHRRKGFTIVEHHGSDARHQFVDDLLTRGFSLSMDNRFQSILEIERELSPLLTPTPVDCMDPQQLAHSLSRQLRTRHRKTQLAMFAEEAQMIIDHVANTVQMQYQSLDAFTVNSYAPHIEYPRLPEELEGLPQHIAITLGVNHHDNDRPMIYVVASRGNKCVLLAYTKVKQWTQSSGGFFGGPRREIAAWHAPEEVAWFEGSAKSILPLVSIHLRRWLTEAMNELTQEMLK